MYSLAGTLPKRAPPYLFLEFYFGFLFQSRLDRPIEICHVVARLIGRSS
jgi:hypothetical protein